MLLIDLEYLLKYLIDINGCVSLKFNRVGSYIPEISTVALLGGLLTLDLFNIVIEKLPLSLHDYYGVRQRNRDLQASGIPQCQWEPRRRFQGGCQGRIE